MNFICRICGCTDYVDNYDNYFCLDCSVEFKSVYDFSLPPVRFIKLSDNAIKPCKAKEGDVGFDLYSTEDKLINPGEILLITTDIAIELPKNTEAQIRTRSGMGKKGIIVSNSPGTIDTGYRGPIGILLFNTNRGYENKYNVKKGDRIAQMIISPKMPYNLVEVNKLTDTERGDTGFNSTGR